MSPKQTKLLRKINLALALISLNNCGKQMPSDVEFTKRMYQFHYVIPGDSLDSIASRYEMSKVDLIYINQLSSPYTIYTGQRLHVHKRRFNELHTIPCAIKQDNTMVKTEFMKTESEKELFDGSAKQKYIESTDLGWSNEKEPISQRMPPKAPEEIVRTEPKTQYRGKKINLLWPLAGIGAIGAGVAKIISSAKSSRSAPSTYPSAPLYPAAHYPAPYPNQVQPVPAAPNAQPPVVPRPGAPVVASPDGGAPQPQILLDPYPDYRPRSPTIPEIDPRPYPGYTPASPTGPGGPPVIHSSPIDHRVPPSPAPIEVIPKQQSNFPYFASAAIPALGLASIAAINHNKKTNKVIFDAKADFESQCFRPCFVWPLNDVHRECFRASNGGIYIINSSGERFIRPALNGVIDEINIETRPYSVVIHHYCPRLKTRYTGLRRVEDLRIGDHIKSTDSIGEIENGGQMLFEVFEDGFSIEALRTLPCAHVQKKYTVKENRARNKTHEPKWCVR